MTDRRKRVAALGVVICSASILLRCTGGQEGTAAEEHPPKKNPIATASAPVAPAAPPVVDLSAQLKAISNAIPVYAGARYREDLTRRDAVMIKNQYGAGAQVFTLATDDSFPQVYHYYTTYLAQFRAYPIEPPYPSPVQNWRTLEVQLNLAMQDPFIPADTMKISGPQVTLQVAETEAEPKTVIRYIITPEPTMAAGAPVVGQ